MAGAVTEWLDYDFNPRSREGSDDGTVEKDVEYIISIHAPARGATNKTLTFNNFKNFNPRSREGSDCQTKS